MAAPLGFKPCFMEPFTLLPGPSTNWVSSQPFQSAHTLGHRDCPNLDISLVPTYYVDVKKYLSIPFGPFKLLVKCQETVFSNETIWVS